MSAESIAPDEPFAEDGGRRPLDALRVALALAVIFAALVSIIEQSAYRDLEARMGAWTVHELLGYSVLLVHSSPTFIFGYHKGGAVTYLGLEVSLACSSVLLVAPAAFVTATLAIVSRIGLLRLLFALAATSLVVTGINLLRFALIAVLVDAWGAQSGFGWAHNFFGSVLTLAGLAAGAYLYYRVVRTQGAARRG